MKKIINGKMYNTESAKNIGNTYGGGGVNDFRYYFETLYLKKTGEFFLAGRGGPMSKYSVQVEQNSWSGGSKIIPLTYLEAKEWAEKALTADEYEDVFGPVKEDDTKQIITLYLQRQTVESLRRQAQESGTGLSALIESKLS